MINVQLNSFKRVIWKWCVHATANGPCRSTKRTILSWFEYRKHRERESMLCRNILRYCCFCCCRRLLSFHYSSLVRDTFFPFHQINNIPGYCSKTYRFFGISHSLFFLVGDFFSHFIDRPQSISSLSSQCFFFLSLSEHSHAHVGAWSAGRFL